MEFTGERFLPTLTCPEISYEHWHRYLYVTEFIKEKKVLDIACGEGYGSYCLAIDAKEVIGVDIDERTIKHASSKYIKDNLVFLVGSVNDIPIEGEKIFDIIVSFETIEHVNKESQEAFLKEIKRLLKSEGTLFISTPDKLIYSDILKYKNEFHKDEFYIEDYQKFLSKYFKNTALLGQKVYPASFIWISNIENRNSVEFQMKLSNNGFVPVYMKDEKQMLYVIAMCSDSDIDIPSNSSLIDVSEHLIKLKNETITDLQGKLQDREREVEGLHQQLQTREREVEGLHQQLQTREREVEELYQKLQIRE